MNKIYIACGCFWGVEEYFRHIKGVITTKVGFANGFKLNPSQYKLYKTKQGYVEACEISYYKQQVGLEHLLEHMFTIIPYAINYQKSKYRLGVYYIESDIISKNMALTFVKNKQFAKTIKNIIEVKPLTTFFLALEQHQKYLQKNPTAYCHIPQKLINNLKNNPSPFIN